MSKISVVYWSQSGDTAAMAEAGGNIEADSILHSKVVAKGVINANGKNGLIIGGVVNCPVASILLSYELFGGSGLVLFAVACGVSYMLSGYYGLYSSQKIMYSKTKPEYININAK